MTAILTGVKGPATVVLICISPLRSEVGHLLMGGLITHTCSLETCLFRYSAHVLIWFFAFCSRGAGVPHMFWIWTLYQIDGWQIFSPLLWVAFSSCYFFFLCCAGTFQFDVNSRVFLLLLLVLCLASNCLLPPLQQPIIFSPPVSLITCYLNGFLKILKLPGTGSLLRTLSRLLFAAIPGSQGTP